MSGRYTATILEVLEYRIECESDSPDTVLDGITKQYDAGLIYMDSANHTNTSVIITDDTSTLKARAKKEHGDSEWDIVVHNR